MAIKKSKQNGRVEMSAYSTGLTPTLRGQEAKDFIQYLRTVRYSPKKARLLQECREIYEKFPTE